VKMTDPFELWRKEALRYNSGRTRPKLKTDKPLQKHRAYCVEPLKIISFHAQLLMPRQRRFWTTQNATSSALLLRDNLS
jgi:hypothetical protein